MYPTKHQAIVQMLKECATVLVSGVVMSVPWGGNTVRSDHRPCFGEYPNLLDDDSYPCSHVAAVERTVQRSEMPTKGDPAFISNCGAQLTSALR